MTTIFAPLPGRILPLSTVPDPVFASGTVGPGCSIAPTDADTVQVVSPLHGVVTKIKPHAAIVTSTKGVSILVHLGIDTVTLRGAGFQELVHEGDILSAGDPLIQWDCTVARENGLSLLVPIIVLEPSGVSCSVIAQEEARQGDELFKVTLP